MPNLKTLLIYLGNFALAFVGITNLLVLIFKFVDPSISPTMVLRALEEKYSEATPKKDPKILNLWVPIEKIALPMQKAVWASEDQRFMEHGGFDFVAINIALEKTEKSNGKIKYGHSTITQQTAKNLFLYQGRTWLRKGLEAWFTVLIEFWWSKKRIMEVYLNLVETGDGIYGVEAAARKYYQKTASALTPSEAATIAACLPNPRVWTPFNMVEKAATRRGRISENMKMLGKLNWDQN